jgi:ABC-2 type transport system permease protein
VIATVRNEWRLLKRDHAFWWLCAAYVALLAYGAAQSVVRVAAQREQVRAAVADQESRWSALRQQAERAPGVWGDWRSPSLVGGVTGASLTWMPADRLTVLASAEAARHAIVQRVSIYESEPEPPIDNPLSLAGGTFDLAFVIQWLMPLVLIAAVHACVSGDRQLGTWRLVAATAASPGRVVTARLLLPSSIIVGLSVGFAVAAVRVSGPLQPGTWWALFAWIVVTMGYAALWVAVAGTASVRSASPAAALVALGLLWMSVVWVLPGVIDAVVTRAYPAPSRLDAYLAERESERDLESRLPEMLEAVYVRHPEWRPSEETVAAARKPVPGGPASRDSRRVYAPSLHAADSAAPFRTAVTERTNRVEDAIHRASALSPSLAMQIIADYVAGRSAAHVAAFEAHTERAQRQWHAFFAPRIMQLRDMTRQDMDAVPLPSAFVPQAPLRTLLWPIVGLVACSFAGVVAFRSALQSSVVLTDRP